MSAENEIKSNFDFLKSKIQGLHIPLPNFKYFHKPSSEEEVFENFIGREEISEQLEEWLVNGDSGAYLVTGYRGMGKSSFVGKVLNRITRTNKTKPRILLFTFFCFTFILTSVLLVFMCLNGYNFADYYLSTKDLFGKGSFEWFLSIVFGLFVISILGSLIIFLCDKLKKYYQNCKKRYYKIDETDYKNHKTWFETFFGIKDIKENKRNIVIKLNLGHETLKEKDILSLIAKRIFETYKEYLNSFYTNGIKIIGKTIILFVGAIFIVSFLDAINISKIIIPKNENLTENTDINAINISKNENLTENKMY